MNKKQALAAGGAAIVTLMMAGTAFAATPATSTTSESHKTHTKSRVIGTVSEVSGTTIVVVGKNGTTYEVNASSATLQKGYGKKATTIALSNIAVNDTVMVRGAISGDSVTATKINDGIPAHKTLKNAAFGTVSGINGSSFTLTRKTKTGTSTVSITTTSATVFKEKGKPEALSDVAVGQRVVVMGVKDSSGNIADATSVNILKAK